MADRVTVPGTYERLEGLPVEIEEIELRRLTYAFSPVFTRVTTCVVLRGGVCVGAGEDVTPFDPAHDGAQRLAAAPGLSPSSACPNSQTSRSTPQRSPTLVPG